MSVGSARSGGVAHAALTPRSGRAVRPQSFASDPIAQRERVRVIAARLVTRDVVTTAAKLTDPRVQPAEPDALMDLLHPVRATVTENLEDAIALGTSHYAATQ